MKRDVLLLLDDASAARIRPVRAKFDPLAAKVPPHVTLVFPRPQAEISGDLLARINLRTLPAVRELEFTQLRISPDGGLWLVPNEESAGRLRSWQAALATVLGFDAGHFEPHVTIGRKVDAQGLAYAARQIPLPLVLECDRVLLEEFGADDLSIPVASAELPVDEGARAFPLLSLGALEVEDLVRAWLDRLPEIARRDPVSARGRILPKLHQLEVLASPETCAFRARRMAPRREAPEAYRERVLRLSDGHTLIAGIRFNNLDPDFPFVEVTGNFSLLRERDPVVVARAVCEEFGIFEPRGMMFTDIATEDSLADGRWIPWDCAVLGPIAERTLAEELPAGVELRGGGTFDHYADYEREYRDWMDKNPHLATHLRIESKADLDLAAAQGLLRSVFFEGKWSGLLAAQSKNYYGLPALYVFEKLLSEKLRGRGLSKFIESAFLVSLRPRFDWVWGYIYGRNFPSLKSALHQGRVPVEARYFVKV